ALQESGGSLDALKQRIAEELKTQRDDKFQAKAQSLPKTLSGATGTGRTSTQVFAPTNLTDLYKR
ncbi:hypothetical protein ABS198_20930, partial [Acinetobacter baumannii]|uniref:hypothetical protein n=1 Tax=Acinetobacter baumannii TaxID=470 RepID=UPI003318D957